MAHNFNYLLKSLIALSSIFTMLVGVFISIVRPYKGDVYVIGSNYGMGVDPNAEVLVRYLLSVGKKVVFVGEYKAIISNSLVKSTRGSFSSAYYFFSSRACFYTHSLSDVIPGMHRLSWFRRYIKFPKLIFLQHGVIGFKFGLSNGVTMIDYIKSLEKTFDKMIVSSDREKKIVEQLGVNSSKIAVTGLPRFDEYSYKTSTADKEALVFFTWQSKECLINKMAGIKESGVSDLLEEAGFQLNYSTHFMQKLPKGEKLTNQKALQKRIRQSTLLITDDSSLAWDMLYLGREVIFYKPSSDWLVNEVFLNQRKCLDGRQLRKRVELFIRNGTTEAEHYQFTKYKDEYNCLRVFDLIDTIDQ